MIDLIFALIAAGTQAGDTERIGRTAAESGVTSTASASVIIGENVAIGSGVEIGGTTTPSTAEARVQEAQFNTGVVPEGLVAEPQEVLGKFTTATEVKPILDVTRGNWVAVREYNGQDLVYISHLWGWRCGLKAVAFSVNGAPLEDWPLPQCHMKYTAPNSILEEDGPPYRSFALGSVQSIDIQIVYDDLSMDAARFERGNVLIP